MTTQRCAHRNWTDYSFRDYDPAPAGNYVSPLIPMDGYSCLTLAMEDLANNVTNRNITGFVEIAVGNDPAGADLTPITASLTGCANTHTLHLNNLHYKFVRVTATSLGAPGITLRALRSNSRDSEAIDTSEVCSISCDKTA